MKTRNKIGLWLLFLQISASVLFTRHVDANRATYSYDASDRLVKVTYSNGTLIAYGYDASGNRISQNISFDEDLDDDGIANAIEDTDQDGVVDPGETDPTNADTDGDGYADGQEDTNRNGIVDPGESDPADPNSIPEGKEMIVPIRTQDGKKAIIFIE